MRFLPKIEPQQDEPLESLLERVRAPMLEALHQKPEIKDTPERIAPAIVFLILLALSIYYFVF
jgi:hypothetical protein